MPTKAKPTPTAPIKSTPRTRPRPAPEPGPEEISTPEEEYPEEQYEDEAQLAPPPRVTHTAQGPSQYQTRAPQPPSGRPYAAPPQQEERSELRFPQGSLFAGDHDSKVIFAGSFHPDELHELIELAREESTDRDKVRIKIFDVDEQYQNTPQHRVRITFCGLQKPRQQSGSGYGNRKTWGKGSKKW